MNAKPFLLLILSLIPGTSSAQNRDARGESTILFVCEHGAARSAIASAYFNKLAQEKGLKYKAIFRGTDPDTMLTPGTINGLRNDGFKMQDAKPTRVTQDDLDKAVHVVDFDCSIPEEMKSERPVVRWDGIPAISKSYPEARDQIVKKVKALVEELEKRK